MRRHARSRSGGRWRPAATVWSVLVAVVLLPGCGGSGGGGGGDVTGPGTPGRTVLFEDTWALGPLEYIPLEADLNVSGTLDVTVDWTFATNDVDVVMTNASCTDEMFSVGQCSFLGSALSTTLKPERFTAEVTAGGSYVIWVVNVGPDRESGSIVVGITQ
jgi:hypothetical protein